MIMSGSGTVKIEGQELKFNLDIRSGILETQEDLKVK
jgi:hypothetical protein